MSAEGCSSSESGWTMYIASPMQEDDKDDDDNVNDADCSSIDDKKKRHVYHCRHHENIAEDRDMDTDDSMASDASSGPTHSHHSEQYPLREDSKDASRLKRDKKKQYASHHNNNNTSKKDQKRNREKSTRKK